MTVYSSIRRVTVPLVLIAVLVMGAALLMGASENPPQFDGDGAPIQPAGYREWIFVGAPITPNSRG